MFIEYRIKFESDGLTITQSTEPSSSSPPAAPGSLFEDDKLSSKYDADESISHSTAKKAVGGKASGVGAESADKLSKPAPSVASAPIPNYNAGSPIFIGPLIWNVSGQGNGNSGFVGGPIGQNGEKP